jgi:hypothetical protein
VVGEWGGSCNGQDGVVQERLAVWMAQNCITDNFWCVRVFGLFVLTSALSASLARVLW